MSRQVGWRLPYCSLKSNGGWVNSWDEQHICYVETNVCQMWKKVVGKWWRTTLCLGGGNEHIFLEFLPRMFGDAWSNLTVAYFFFVLGWNQPTRQAKKKEMIMISHGTWLVGVGNPWEPKHTSKKIKDLHPQNDFSFLPLMSRVRKESMRISERPRPHGVAWCQVENSWGSFFQHPKQEIYQLQNGNFQIWWYSNWWWYSSWFQLI